MKKFSLFLLVCALVWGCKSMDTDLAIREAKKIELNKSYEAFQEAQSRRSSTPSDPFVISSAILFADVLQVEVAYGGGCKNHEFKAYLNKTNNGATLEILIHHEANDDQCEAYLTDILEISLEGEVDGNEEIKVLNGSSQEEIIADFSPCRLLTGDTCEIELKAERAICGVGLWGDLWLKPERGIWYQPASQASNFPTPQEGKTYLVKLAKSAPFQYDGVQCMAYPGSSTPVKIISIREIE